MSRWRRFFRPAVRSGWPTTAISSFKAGLGDSWPDTTTAPRRLILTVLGGLAEFERELIRAHTGERRTRAVANGVKRGRKPKLTPAPEGGDPPPRQGLAFAALERRDDKAPSSPVNSAFWADYGRAAPSLHHPIPGAFLILIVAQFSPCLSRPRAPFESNHGYRWFRNRTRCSLGA
jgi:Resolvase, N terminal domain